MSIFSPLHIKGLNKLGDAYIPGDEDLPSFSHLGCAEEADQVVAHIPAADLKDLQLLMTVFAFTPRLLIVILVRFLEWAPSMPWFFGGSFMRFLRMGIKGLSVTLYWSGFKGKNYQGVTPLEFIDFEVNVVQKD